MSSIPPFAPPLDEQSFSSDERERPPLEVVHEASNENIILTSDDEGISTSDDPHDEEDDMSQESSTTREDEEPTAFAPSYDETMEVEQIEHFSLEDTIKEEEEESAFSSTIGKFNATSGNNTNNSQDPKDPNNNNSQGKPKTATRTTATSTRRQKLKPSQEENQSETAISTISKAERELVLEVKQEIQAAKRELEARGAKPCQSKAYVAQQKGIVDEWAEMVEQHILANLPANDKDVQATVAVQQQLRETLKKYVHQAQATVKELGHVQPQLQAIQYGIVKPKMPDGPPFLDADQVGKFVSKCTKLQQYLPQSLAKLDLFEQEAYLPNEQTTSTTLPSDSDNNDQEFKFTLKDVQDMRRDILELLGIMEQQLQQLQEAISEQVAGRGMSFYQNLDPLDEDDQQNVFLHAANLKSIHYKWFDEQRRAADVAVAFFEQRDKANVPFYQNWSDQIAAALVQFEENRARAIAATKQGVEENDRTTTENATTTADLSSSSSLQQLHTKIQSAQEALDSNGAKPCQSESYVAEQESIVQRLEQELAETNNDSTAAEQSNVTSALEKFKSTLQSYKTTAEKELSELGYVQAQLQAIHWGVVKPDGPDGPPYVADEVGAFVAKAVKVLKNSPRQLATLNLFEKRAYLPNDGQVKFGMNNLKEMQANIQESVDYISGQLEMLENHVETGTQSAKSLVAELETQDLTAADQSQLVQYQSRLDECKQALEVGVEFYNKKKETAPADECTKLLEQLKTISDQLKDAISKAPTLSTTDTKHLLRLQHQIKAAQHQLEKDGPKPCQHAAYVSQQEAVIKLLKERLASYSKECPSDSAVKVATFSMEELESTLQSNKHVADKVLREIGYVQPQLQAIQYSISKPEAPPGHPYQPEDVAQFVDKCNKIVNNCPRQLASLAMFEERAYLPDDGEVRFGMKDLKQMQQDIGELESFIKEQLDTMEKDIEAGKASLETDLENWAAMDLGALDKNSLAEHHRKLDAGTRSVEAGVAFYEGRRDKPKAAEYLLLLGKMEVIGEQLADAERIMLIDLNKMRSSFQRGEKALPDPNQYIEHGTLEEAEDETDFDDRIDADDDVEKARIKFRPKLYGRDSELTTLHGMYDEMSESADGQRKIVFLGGYSGTGKSALVEEFVRQIDIKHRKDKDHCLYLAGKFGQVKAGDPFSALMQALNKYMLSLLFRSPEELKPFEERLRKFDIYLGSENFQVLSETLTPALAHVLRRAGADSSSEKEETSSSGAAASGNIEMIKFAFLTLVRAMATEENPMVFFIDDLQWSDSASLQLLSSALKDSSIKHVIFICAYRSNEIYDGHGFATMKEEVSVDRSGILPVEIELSNLSPESVGELIAECLWMKREEVSTLTDSVYVKTMGNVFFVKQAVEELVRKNVIYYDLVTFSWNFGDVSHVELQQYLTKDVIGMVQSKLRTMPKTLQTALSLAAYTNNSFDLDLIFDLLGARQEELDEVLTKESLKKYLSLAFTEGLVLIESSSSLSKHLQSPETPSNPENGENYKFAHDRIREAACELIPDGNERHQFLLGIAGVLLDLGQPGEKDWMLFTAARHMNSVPEDITDDVEMANLNLDVGKIAIFKGAFDDALVLLRAAENRLNRTGSPWIEHYDLTLGVFNSMAESEAALGNHEKAMLEAETIFHNAKCLSDKVRAQSTYIESQAEMNKEDYSVWVSKAVEILAEHEIDVPGSPSFGQVRNEVIKFGLALRGRSIFCLTKFPVATDEKVSSAITLANVVLRRAVVNTRMFLAGILAYRILRIAINKKIITKDIFTVVWSLTFTFRKREKFKNAFDYSAAGTMLRDRFPPQTGKEDIVPQVAPIAVSSYQVPYQDTIQPWLDLHKQLMFRGLSEVGLACAMFAIYAHFCASLPLNTLFDTKLILIEEMSRSLGRDLFVELALLLRQCCYNINGDKRKASKNPLLLDGPIFNEAEVLANYEGATLKSLKRDTAVMRLYLAVIFNDVDLMEQMMVELDPIPAYDNLVGRQHVRLTFSGIAALVVLRYKKQDDMLEKWATTSTKFFEKLSKMGSPNAKPVLLCLQALEDRTVAGFDSAIGACVEANLIHLAAIMNEQCGVWLLQRARTGEVENERQGCTLWLPNMEKQVASEAALDLGQKHESYLKSALTHYQIWGAAQKATQLEEQYVFLRRSESMRWKGSARFTSGLPVITDVN